MVGMIIVSTIGALIVVELVLAGYKYIIICTLLSVYTTVSGTVTVCIPFNNAETHGQLENYSELVKVLKQDLTELLAEEASLTFEHLEFDFQHPALAAKGEVNDVSVVNLYDYELKFFNDVDIMENKIEVFNLTFHNISVTGEYNMTGNVGDLFDIFGEGDFWASNVNFSLSATTNLPSINSTHACLSLDINVTLQKMMGWFSNLMNDDELEELMNHAFAVLIPEAVEIIWGEFKDVADGPIQEWIDSVINKQSQYILTKIMNSQDDQRLRNGSL